MVYVVQCSRQCSDPGKLKNHCTSARRSTGQPAPQVRTQQSIYTDTNRFQGHILERTTALKESRIPSMSTWESFLPNYYLFATYNAILRSIPRKLYSVSPPQQPQSSENNTFTALVMSLTLWHNGGSGSNKGFLHFNGQIFSH